VKSIVKRGLLVFILAVFLANAAIACFLFRSRELSHLAVWNIIESGRKEDFYWPPEKAPRYFAFDPPGAGTKVFKNEIYPLAGDEKDELNAALKVARYVMDISSRNNQLGLPLRWDSPDGMLRQIKEGASPNCFHRAILFSTYLTSLGIKSRLWALENDNFDAVAHSVNEVYLAGLKKWVFMDITFGFYARAGDTPLSFLEFRERLLNAKAGSLSVCSLGDSSKKQYKVPVLYPKLVRCVFLRSRNDFSARYFRRYGIFSIFREYIDRANDGFRRGMEYLLGAQDSFSHYTDSFSPSLKIKITAIKLFLCFCALSIILVLLLVILQAYLYCFRKR
jgi:hypothetical protein